MTYAELRRTVAQAAGAWRTMGVKRGERVALADGDGLTTLVAAYVSDGDAAAAAAALQRALAPLPPYQRPTRCIAFAALPRTLTGKLLRRELVARLQRGAAT
jgi:acyl-coenzyme A synthetase/AMP-(fatty) acid ligase